MNRLSLPVVALALLGGVAGCSDYAVEQLPPDAPGEAALLVEPLSLDFGELALGESASETLTLSNPGSAGLTLDAPVWSGSGAFSLLDSVAGVELPAGESLEIEVAYAPQDLEHQAILQLSSSDLADEDAVGVTLYGGALVPRLSFDPDPLDFGGLPPGCDESATVDVVNTGSAPLTLESLVLQSGPFSALSEPVMPVVLEPEERVSVELLFAPVEFAAATTLLWASSDDPAGARSGTILGEGVEPARFEETFKQADGPWEKLDFVFYIDQSGSMQDNQRKLSEQADSFMEHLSTKGLDWQIATVTRSTGCFNVVLSSEAGSTASGFADALSGPFDSSTEKGMYVMQAAMEATQEGECNAGFLREDARAALIFVSDEPDQSPDGWDAHLIEILSHAGGASIASIVGDLPEGCDTAEPGLGYTEAALATNGAVMSICEDEWSDYLEDYTDLVSEEPTDTFVLGDSPDPDSIVVTVEGEEVDGWTYSEDLNAVVFDEGSWPEGGEDILISYWQVGACE